MAISIGPGISWSSGVRFDDWQPPPNGQVEYTTAGTYSWTAPAGVTSVSVVCVGGGGGALQINGSSGGGGGLGWKNNISVTPGQSYTVVVGAAGTSGGSPTSGGDSYFIQNDSNSYCSGKGGLSGPAGGTGGTYYGDGGGNGGQGGAGGGGAGGYAASTTNDSGDAQFGRVEDNSGSGAGGNSQQGGGGVGIYGKGASGLYGGNGGSGGGSAGYSEGGAYGGGAAKYQTQFYGQPGGGAVRIIWGTNRAFPDTNTGNL